MTKKIFDYTLIALGALCFLIGFVVELFHFNIESCWLIAAMLLSVLLVFFPKSILRVNKKKYNFWFNALIVLASVVLLFVCVFLMLNLIYFAVSGTKLIPDYQGYMYPAILLFCLMESYIDFVCHEKYKKHLDLD